jgi:hypothetical protein
MQPMSRRQGRSASVPVDTDHARGVSDAFAEDSRIGHIPCIPIELALKILVDDETSPDAAMHVSQPEASKPFDSASGNKVLQV